MSIIQTLILLNISEISGLKSAVSPNLWLSQSGILDGVYCSEVHCRMEMIKISVVNLKINVCVYMIKSYIFLQK